MKIRISTKERLKNHPIINYDYTTETMKYLIPIDTLDLFTKRVIGNVCQITYRSNGRFNVASIGTMHKDEYVIEEFIEEE